MFRDVDGKARVLDAYCPHLGAHLADGEIDHEDGKSCIKCPFHGWAFRADDGTCVNVPYAKDGSKY